MSMPPSSSAVTPLWRAPEARGAFRYYLTGSDAIRLKLRLKPQPLPVDTEEQPAGCEDPQGHDHRCGGDGGCGNDEHGGGDSQE